MTQQVLELVQALCEEGQDEELLRTLCVNACQMLDRRLRDGVTREDCEGAYPLAAAWLALGWLRDAQVMSGVTALSAGDMTVRREGGGDGGELFRRAMDLMAPFLRDDGFVFRGVRG